MNLVIVESPAKAKTIEGYLGDNYKVLSSVGHIMDLATSGPGGLGIDIEHGFKPTYKVISGKSKIIKELKKVAKEADNIYIATDLDREGEAIGFHLMEQLNLDPDQTNRIVFTEITKKGIEDGIKHPRVLDKHLVDSQETRRMIDRIIGFKLSALLKQKIKVKSAGRVQSVALKMIVERENEINAFKPQKYYKLKAINNNLEFEYEKNDKLLDKETIDKLLKKINNEPLEITDIKVKSKKVNAKLPYITSTFQQDCINQLNFSSKKAMQIAQKLYEGIEINGQQHGLITYMRTDSTRLSADFVKQAHRLIENSYGKEYVGKYKNKKNKNAQDAHEAIRPTHLDLSPNVAKQFLTNDEYKVYKLIYNRALMSLMAPAIQETTTFIATVNRVKFKLSNSQYAFDGFKKLDTIKQNDPIALQIGQKLEATYLESEHETQPPARYSEAKLIKELEANGVGRPSTYATIIDILKKRDYVSVVDKRFKPTEDGFLVVKNLDDFFNKIINIEYTSHLEKLLDEIAQGDAKELNVLTDFYNDFSALYEVAQTKMQKIEAKKVDELCPECHSDLVERKGRFGKFIACSNYPKCRYIKPTEVKVVGQCPECGGDVIEKRTKRGKIMYGCKNYPDCTYAVWDLKDIPKS